jgi:hypothetical protein
MRAGVEQLAIVLLGAFAVMLLITLASEPWKSPERTPILALIVAIAALVWSGANTFFTFFWHPEDLRVYIRSPNAIPPLDTPPQEITDTVDVNYFFSNMGNQAALIENVAIGELWIKSTIRHPAELDRCISEGYLAEILSSLASPPVRHEITLTDGSGFRLARPTKIYIDGSETNRHPRPSKQGK